MPYLTKDDLITHLYPEIRDEITRSNDLLITKAINEGIGEAKSYLNRYDMVKMFSDDVVLRTFKDDFLDGVVKDIVCWKLIKLANPNINLALFRTAYEDAIKFLEKVMKGQTDPAWPLRPDDPATPFDESGNIGWRSNIKRTNHY
jgi:phage gp36-like protein